MENNNNINVNHIFECLEPKISLKSKIDAESILADHLARAFNLLDRVSTKLWSLQEDV